MMRPRLKWALCAALLIAGGSAHADDRPIAAKWAEVEANAEIFRKTATRLNFTSSWERSRPIRLDFLPPATEAEVKTVERQMGETLPDSLREFFLQATAGVEIFWLVPGKTVVTDGLTTVDYHLLPPPPWREVSAAFGPGSERDVPVINGGVLTFGLGAMLGNRARASGWRDGFFEYAETATDETEAAHYRRYGEFWTRGLPLAFDGGGDVLAVDKDDPEGRLIFLYHDGSDEPGWFLEMTPIDFMVMQSRLGFPGIGQSEFASFNAPDTPPGAQERAYSVRHGDEAERLGLAMPSSVVMSTDAPGADIWRAWLGL